MQEPLQLLFFCEIDSWQSCCHVPGTAPSSLREDIKGGSPLRIDVKSCTGWTFASREQASISVILCSLEIPCATPKIPAMSWSPHQLLLAKAPAHKTVLSMKCYFREE